ncbi:unnamed protein product [Amoebophrya sp. A25]|nr:unnamed protein product [Amoebophrya sp. A25]|eukprot:GSA25T00002955001.1
MPKAPRWNRVKPNYGSSCSCNFFAPSVLFFAFLLFSPLQSLFAPSHFISTIIASVTTVLGLEF